MAQKELQEDGINIKLIKSLTQEDSGSPDITGLIWKQIQTADVFVGDLTFAETTIGLSNNNVMYEVGIADALLGEDRVVLLLFICIYIKLFDKKNNNYGGKLWKKI